MQGIVTLHGVEHHRCFRFYIHSLPTSEKPSIKWYQNIIGGNVECVEPEYIPTNNGKKIVAARYRNKDGKKRWERGDTAFRPWFSPIDVVDSALNVCFGKLLYLNKDGLSYKAFYNTEPIVKHLLYSIDYWRKSNNVNCEIYYNNKLV